MPTSTTAAIFRHAGQPPQIEPVTLDDPREDEVLVEIKGVGICHTDMVMRDGQLPVPMPVVLGHEGSGIVRAVGAKVGSLQPGDHVVLSFMSCASCASCHELQPAYCHSWVPLNFFGMRADGSTALVDASGQAIHSHVFGQSSFAGHAVVNQRNAIKVASDVPIELLGPLGCGIQTGAGAVLNSCRVRPGSSVAVIGVGAVGLSAIMAARVADAAIVAAIDINQGRLDLARELGANQAFISGAGTFLEMAAASGCHAGFDYIIDTTGISSLVEQAVPALAPRGEIALVGAYRPGTLLAIDPVQILSTGRVIRGVVEGGANPAEFIPELIELWRAGRFPFDRLVQFFEFSDIVRAIEEGEQGRVIKPILRFA